MPGAFIRLIRFKQNLSRIRCSLRTRCAQGLLDSHPGKEPQPRIVEKNLQCRFVAHRSNPIARLFAYPSNLESSSPTARRGLHRYSHTYALEFDATRFQPRQPKVLLRQEPFSIRQLNLPLLQNRRALCVPHSYAFLTLFTQLSKSFGQIQGKIDAEAAHSAQLMNRLDDSIEEVGEKMSAMDTRLTALNLNVSRIHWRVAAGAVVIGVLGPFVYLGVKRLLNIA